MVGAPIPVHITHAAFLDVEKFFEQHPDLKLRERQETGICPVIDPDRYFGIELTEPVHSDVRMMVELHDGVLGRQGVAQWAQEELGETARHRKPTSICPGCKRQFDATGSTDNPYCSLCTPVRSTARAPPGLRFPGSPLYPGAAAVDIRQNPDPAAHRAAGHDVEPMLAFGPGNDYCRTCHLYLAPA